MRCTVIDVMKCDKCEAIRDCKHAFGKYWPDKSHDGDGCSFQFRGWNVNIPALPPQMMRTVSQGTFDNERKEKHENNRHDA